MVVTRTVPVVHCAVTHGGTAVGIPGQPATVHGAEIVAAAIPKSVTLGLGTDGIACPPCRHITTAP